MRIVLAEDQVLLRDGLVRLLSGAGHTVVGQVGDARSLIDETNAQRPDLVISDIRMPPDHTDDGARAVMFLRDRFPSLATVVLSQVVEPGLVALLSNGHPQRFGYLLKDRVLEIDVFLDQLDTVAAGGTVIDPAVVDGYLHREERRLADLTQREREVLARLAGGRSNAGIAQDLVISPRTVEAHLRTIFTKLGIESSAAENQRVLAVLRWLDAATDVPARD